MPATSARIVPLIALASRDSSAAANVIWPSATVIATRGVVACVSVPSGPFTVILSAAIWMSTPFATSTGTRAIRDMFLSAVSGYAT